MKLEKLGEHGYIDHLKKRFIYSKKQGILCGIGDDCAVLAPQHESYQLVTIDSLVEGIHFIKSQCNPSDLGYKALAINLSDIASMGGTPTHAVLTLALPKDLEVSWIDSFYDGFEGLAKKYQVKLVGGNLSKTPGPIFIDVCLHGAVAPHHLKLRSKAKKGDIVCVTGFLGDSRAGLLLQQSKTPALKGFHRLISTHQRPFAHVKEGIWLGKQESVHAMIDISDGLASDLKRLLESSKVGFRIDIDHLPISPELTKAGETLNWDVRLMAAQGGEDYCLLLTVDPEGYAELNKAFKKKFGKPLSKIGRVDKAKKVSYYEQGKPVQWTIKGFDHFGKMDKRHQGRQRHQR